MEGSDDAAAVLAEARSAASDGDLRRATAVLAGFLIRHPNAVEPLRFAALLRAECGDGHRARRLLLRALAIEPGRAATWLDLGRVEERLGHLDEAAVAYAVAFERDPGNSDAALILGRVEKRAGRFAAAVAAFRRAVAVNPGGALGWRRLGAVLHRAGETEEACTALRAALARDPTDACAWETLGRSLSGAGRHSEALKAFEQAIALRPGFAVAWNNLGNVRRRADDPGGALAAYRQAIALEPDFPVAHENLGRTLLDEGEYEAALVPLAMAIELTVEGNGVPVARERPRRDFDKGHRARDALLAAAARLRAAGIEHFLCCGTLLGLVREGRLLPYDHDLDLGVWGDADPEALAAAFGDEVVRQEFWHDRPLRLIVETQGSVYTDIYYHHRHAKCVTYGLLIAGRPVDWYNTSFELACRWYDGFEFLVPANAERYLTETYGPDWRVPDPDFDGVTCTPNVVERCVPLMRGERYHALLRALNGGATRRALRIADFILANDPPSHPSIAAVRARLTEAVAS